MTNRTALVLHGRNCTPDMFWYPYIARELEAVGYNVNVPLLPDNSEAARETWVPFLKENFTYTPESILIGVSSSCAAILELIEGLGHPVKKVILVAGFITPLLDNTSHPVLKDSYDWDKIRGNIVELYIINSDTDRTGADRTKGEEIFNKLGGTQIIMKDQEHFGSIKHDQPYKEFPLLKRLIQE